MTPETQKYVQLRRQVLERDQQLAIARQHLEQIKTTTRETATRRRAMAALAHVKDMT
jgi:hypothetical protein